MHKLFCRIFQFFSAILSACIKFKQPIILKDYDELIASLENYIQKSSAERSVLFVTTNSMNKLGYAKTIIDKLQKNNFGVIVFDKVKPNPTVEYVEEAFSLLKATKTQIVIALGGGSAIDLAKGVSAKLARPNKTLMQMKGLFKVHKRKSLLIAIPTTAGTGSEATLSSVITDSKTHYKFAINDPCLIPDYALLDEKLTLALPPDITAYTGLDALSHAVEVYISKSPFRKNYAKKAIIMIMDNLKKAYENGNDLEARKNMLYASFYAGLAFTKAGVGNIHALSHQVSAFYDSPHGRTNATLMPYILEIYGKKTCSKLDKIIHSDFLQKLKKMNEEMHIPAKLNEIKEKDIEIMAKRAENEANPLYPSPKIFSKSEIEKIYKDISN